MIGGHAKVGLCVCAALTAPYHTCPFPLFHGQPSDNLICLQYLAGAASSLFGNDSGEETKNEAVKEMRAASELSGANAPSQKPGIMSTIEQKAGELVGCEGMEKQGAESSETSDRVGAQSN